MESTSSNDEDDTDFLAFFASSYIIYPPTVTSDAQEFLTKNDEDEQYEFLNFYSVFLLKHIKLEKS